MAILDDELMQDAQYDAEVIAHVRQQIPQELKENLDDDTLYYFHDLIEEFLADSNMLDAEPDEDGFVEIDIEEIAKHLQKKATKEGVGNFTIDDLLFVVEAELSFGDDFEEE